MNFPTTFVSTTSIPLRRTALPGSFATRLNSDRRANARGFISKRAFSRLIQQPCQFNVHNVQVSQANLSSETGEDTGIVKDATSTAQTDSPSPIILDSDDSTSSPSLSSSSSGETHDGSSISTSSISQQSVTETLEAMSGDDRTRIETTREYLELWLSAINLRRDWYLRRQMNPDGWLDPSVFLLFNRIKAIKASLDDIILAAQLSEDIEVSTPSGEAGSFGDDSIQTRIRRSSMLPDFSEWDDSELEKSFILKSIPHDSTVESLQQLFGPFEKPTYVHVYRSRNNPEVAPRALVYFDKKETADKVFQVFATNAPAEADGILIRRRHLPLKDPNHSIVAKTNSSAQEQLIILHFTNLPPAIDWKYLHRLLNEAVLLRAGRRPRYLLYDPEETECYLTVSGGPAVRNMVTVLCEKGLRISGEMTSVRHLQREDELNIYWEKVREHNEKRRSVRQERLGNESESGDGDDTGNDGQVGKLKYRNNIYSRPKGVVAKITGLNPDLAWKKIHMDLSKLTKVIYLNYTQGSDSCYVRAISSKEAEKLVYMLNGDEDKPPSTVGGTIVQASQIEGEEEEEYWKQVEEQQRMRTRRLSEYENKLDLESIQSEDEVKDIPE